MIYDKLASSIRLDIVGGLRGLHHNMSLSVEQLQDSIVNTRLQIIKEYSLKGILPVNDLLLSINCIKIDCKDIERCSLCSGNPKIGTPTMHFEIPQIVTDFGNNSISYIGSPDRTNPFIFYTSSQQWNYYHKYRRMNKNKPFVFIDIAPNENGMYDCFVFNAPLMKSISVVAVFKDPRQLEEFGCCDELENDQFSWINAEIQDRLVKYYVNMYRKLAPPNLPNDQAYAAG